MVHKTFHVHCITIRKISCSCIERETFVKIHSEKKFILQSHEIKENVFETFDWVVYRPLFRNSLNNYVTSEME